MTTGVQSLRAPAMNMEPLHGDPKKGALAQQLGHIGNNSLPAPAAGNATSPQARDGSTGLRHSGLAEVFAATMQQHSGRIAAANIERAVDLQGNNAPVALQDVYTAEQISAGCGTPDQRISGHNLSHEAFELALDHCQLKEKHLARWQQAGNTPGTITVSTAGYLLMDPALPAPLRAKLVAALQAYTQLGDPRGTYLGTTKTDIATDRLADLRKAIGQVAREAHLGKGGYEGLQRVLLDRMMPAVLASIQERFPGTNLQTAASQLPRFVSAEALEWYQAQVTGFATAKFSMETFYHQVEQMALHFIKLPELIAKGDAPPAQRDAAPPPAAPALPSPLPPGPVGGPAWPYPPFSISNIGNPKIENKFDFGELGKLLEGLKGQGGALEPREVKTRLLSRGTSTDSGQGDEATYAEGQDSATDSIASQDSGSIDWKWLDDVARAAQDDAPIVKASLSRGASTDSGQGGDKVTDTEDGAWLDGVFGAAQEVTTEELEARFAALRPVKATAKDLDADYIALPKSVAHGDAQTTKATLSRGTSTDSGLDDVVTDAEQGQDSDTFSISSHGSDTLDWEWLEGITDAEQGHGYPAGITTEALEARLAALRSSEVVPAEVTDEDLQARWAALRSSQDTSSDNSGHGEGTGADDTRSASRAHDSLDDRLAQPKPAEGVVARRVQLLDATRAAIIEPRDKVDTFGTPREQVFAARHAQLRDGLAGSRTETLTRPASLREEVNSFGTARRHLQAGEVGPLARPLQPSVNAKEVDSFGMPRHQVQSVRLARLDGAVDPTVNDEDVDAFGTPRSHVQSARLTRLKGTVGPAVSAEDVDTFGVRREDVAKRQIQWLDNVPPKRAGRYQSRHDGVLAAIQRAQPIPSHDSMPPERAGLRSRHPSAQEVINQAGSASAQPSPAA